LVYGLSGVSVTLYVMDHRQLLLVRKSELDQYLCHQAMAVWHVSLLG